MKLLPLLITILILSSLSSIAQSRKSLPSPILNQLDAKFPGWRFAQNSHDVKDFFAKTFPKAIPSLIKGDFDRNGKPDFAILIEHSNFAKAGKELTHVVEVLAFLKRGASYKRISLNSGSPADNELYLNLAKKGKIGKVFATNKKFAYRHDSISLSFFEKASGTYVWKNGKFVYVYESD